MQTPSMLWVTRRRVFRVLAVLVILVPLPLIGEEAATLTREQRDAIAGLPQVSGPPNPRLAVERTESKRIVGTLQAELKTPSMKVATWVFITPEPPNLPGQERIQTKTNWKSELIHDRSPLQRPLLRSRVAGASAGRASSLAYDCQLTLQLFARRLVPRGRQRAPVVKLPEDQRKVYLRPDRTFDYTTADFKRWKEEHKFSRTRRESEVEFAQRVFRTIANRYEYLYEPKQDRSASRLCRSNRTDCGGLSILFATVLRSEAIPARILVGRWAKSANKSSGRRQDKFHVIAEFYAAGIGWIPVDGSSAVLHDPTPEKLEFFGNQAGNFVTLHIDTDLEFDTGLWGDHTARFFQVPKPWFQGQGRFDDKTFEHDWRVRETEIRSGRAAGVARASTSAPAQREYVYLPLTHLRQAERLCAPTSASIVLLRYGMKLPPERIKQLANSVATDKTFPGTYFADMVAGLKTVGLDWKHRRFASDAAGLSEGLTVIEQSLRRGHPVIIDIHVPPNGHTVVVNGIDPNRKLISIVDPNIAAPGLRRWSFAEFDRSWRSVTDSARGCILTAPSAR